MHEDFSRVILHIDFDCYYVQVEMKRLGIPRELPCAVQQWEGLIAVNYPARSAGVTRHMRVNEAKKVCPELVTVHVETIGMDGSGSGGNNGAGAGEDIDGGGGEEGDGGADGDSRQQQQQQELKTNRLTQKACLERYRRSTAEVLALLHRLAPGAVIEKASIDEVYIDVTAMVEREVQGSAAAPAAPVDAFAWGSIVIGGPLDVNSEFERRLAVGAGIACRLRGKLLEELAYTSSAGIAANKLLAKLGSALNKPNLQTVIPPRSALTVMQDLPLKKVRNFGGKLGEQLEALGCTTAGQVQQLPHATLVAHFGADRAGTIEQAVRGISHEPVQERERPKSMLAAKSFNATSDLSALQGWFRVLAQELAGRMAADEALYRRRPKNLVVHYRGGNQSGTERSKCCAMPRAAATSAGGATSAAAAEAITEAAFALFKSKCAGEALPCSRLAIAAADFADLPATNGSAITRFLVPKAAAAADADASAVVAAGGGSDSGTGGQQQEQRQQQPGAAQGPQQQQQQAGGGAAAAGPSISSLFERVQKRQRLEQQQEQQQQQQQHGEAVEPAGTHVGTPTAAAAASLLPVAAAAAAAPATASPLPVVPAAAAAPAAAGIGLEPAAAGGREKTPEAAAAAGVPQPGEAGAEAAAEPNEEAAAAAAAVREGELAEVDVAEQRRILKHIQMLSRSKPASGQAAEGAGSGGGRAGGRRAGGRSPGKQQQAQRGIAAFFNKPPPQK